MGPSPEQPGITPDETPSSVRDATDSTEHAERARRAAQKTALADLESDVAGVIADDRADATTSTLPGSPAAGAQTTEQPKEESWFKSKWKGMTDWIKNSSNELKTYWRDKVGDKPSELMKAMKEGFHEVYNFVAKKLGFSPLADKKPDAAVEGPTPQGIEMVPMDKVCHPDAPIFSFCEGVRTRLTSPYGYRVAPQTKDGRHGSDNHGGVDIGCPEGSKIVCMVDGLKVLRAYQQDETDLDEGGGYCLELEAPDGIGPITLMHLKILPTFPPGTVLRKGMVMAISGNTGNSSGPHLHFQVGHGKSKKDPERWLHPDYYRANEDKWVG